MQNTYSEEMQNEILTCKMCGCSQISHVGSNKDISDEVSKMYLCSSCNSISRLPIPDQEKVDSFYEKSGNFSKLTPNHIARREKHARSQINFVVEFLRSQSDDPSNYLFIDIGAGIGLHCKVALDLGFSTAVGFEPREWACSYGKREFSVNLQQKFADRFTITDLLNSENAKKVIIFTSHCLEHIVHPSNFIEEFSLGNLSVSSDTELYFMVAVPDVNIETYSFFNQKRSKLWKQHMQSFSAQGMKNLLERAGLEVLYQKQVTNPVRAAGVKLNYWVTGFGILGLPIKFFGKLLNIVGAHLNPECSVDLPIELRTMAKCSRDAGIQ